MGGADQVLGVDLGAVGVEDRGLDGARQELIGMAAEELVEGVLAGDVHGESMAATASAPPHLLETGDGARKRDADRGVERANVDPELERVGRDHAEQLARAQPPLDLLALGRRVAGAVGGDSLGELRVEAIDGVAEDQLDALARLHEADGPGAGGDQLGEHLSRLVESRATQAQRLVKQWRVPHRHPARGGGRRVTVDKLEVRQPRQLLRQLDRVRDRRAREQKPRRRAVDGGDPPHPPEHVGNVRAEHAAINVGLIEDDEREVREQVAPRGMVREDPDVEHVRIGQHEVAALADRGALGPRRIAVVDRRSDRLVQTELVQRASLILGQRLGRVEVQRAGRPVGAQHLERGQLKAQRLARRRSGRDDRRPSERLLYCLGLMCVELGDAHALER